MREKGVRDEEGSGGELGSDLDPWKILWIWIRIQQNDADPLDPDPQHCLAYPPSTPIPHTRPGVWYICGLQVQVQQPEQTR